jgi:predicted small lipoprotein YifL
MKKNLLFVLILIFSLSLIAGCGGGPANPPGQAAQTSRLPDPQPQDNTVKKKDVRKSMDEQVEEAAKTSKSGWKRSTIKGKGLRP